MLSLTCYLLFIELFSYSRICLKCDSYLLVWLFNWGLSGNPQYSVFMGYIQLFYPLCLIHLEDILSTCKQQLIFIKHLLCHYWFYTYWFNMCCLCFLKTTIILGRASNLPIMRHKLEAVMLGSEPSGSFPDTWNCILCCVLKPLIIMYVGVSLLNSFYLGTIHHVPQGVGQS